MAYYGSNFEGDAGDYYRTPYNGNYDIVPFQDSGSYSDYHQTQSENYYSSHNFLDTKFIEYNLAPNSTGYVSSDTQYRISYSTAEFNEPKFIEYYQTQPENCYSSHSFLDTKFLEYNPTPNSTGYVSSDTQYRISYSTADFNEPKFIEYYQNQPENSYSSHNFLDTKFLAYNPTPYQTGYVSSNTQYRISYSTSEVNKPESMEFNELDFPEYDPTPYGGGYDIAQTYGKPLLPSDEICYPHSTSQGKKNEDISKLPPKHEDISSNGSKQAVAVEEEQRKSNDGYENGHGGQDEKALDPNIQVQGEETGREMREYDYPCSGYDYGYGYDKKVAQSPSNGCGSDSVGFCESIFGYWPCLSERDQKRYGGQEIAGGESGGENQWKSAADYIFASEYCSYSEEMREGGGSYENVIFGYQRHYPEQAHYMQVEYDEPNHYSWLHNSSIY